jgi:hypothetical protein
MFCTPPNWKGLLVVVVALPLVLAVAPFVPMDEAGRIASNNNSLSELLTTRR